MIVALSDTHADDAPALAATIERVLGDADLVVHAGDFTTPVTHDVFDDRATNLVAVHGNSDGAELRTRLPAVRTVERGGVTLLVVHGHEHDRTSLPLAARECGADLAIVGHTHRPGIEWIGDLAVVNPGSHADPRGGPPTFAVLEEESGQLSIEVRTVAGETVERDAIEIG